MSKETDATSREIIRAANDAFRTSGPIPGSGIEGRKLHTSGIAAFAPSVVADIWKMVAEFNSFTDDNDPYGEHDFGAFDQPIAGRIFWKIDYYDSAYEYGAEDPADPSTRRVLTVMRADEY